MMFLFLHSREMLEAIRTLGMIIDDNGEYSLAFFVLKVSLMNPCLLLVTISTHPERQEHCFLLIFPPICPPLVYLYAI